MKKGILFSLIALILFFGVHKVFADPPIPITNWNDLETVRTDMTADYILMADLDQNSAGYADFAGATAWGNAGFFPLSDLEVENSFTGSFDGNNHTISDIVMLGQIFSGMGLFSSIGVGGDVFDLTINNMSITNGAGRVASLAGNNSGTITNVNVTSTNISTSSCNQAGGLIAQSTATSIIVDSTATVAVDTTDGSCNSGGLVGENSGSITNSHAYGNVETSNFNQAGGLVGYNFDGDITTSSAHGNVSGVGGTVGGLVGSMGDGAITKSYAEGNVSNSGASPYVGGLVGSLISPASVSDSYAMGDVTAPSGLFVGGLVGYDGGSDITRTFSKGEVDVNPTYHGGLVGFADSLLDIEFSFYDTQTSGLGGDYCVDDGDGAVETAGCVGKMTSAMKDIDTYTTDLGVNAWDFGGGGDWSIDGINNDGYPYLAWQDYGPPPDTTDPAIDTLSPPDGDGAVAVDTNLVITFDEAVNVGTGNISIFKSEGDLLVEAIDVESGAVTGTGTDTITINPSITLEELTDYYVQIDATAFDDLADNSFAGIADETTWNFTTGQVFASGIGIEGDPFIITDCDQLQNMNLGLDFFFRLEGPGDIIDCSGTTSWNEDPDNLGTFFGFEPIGSTDIPFAGNLDGNNNTITNLYINRPFQDFVGLFSAIDSGTSISDFGLTDVDITGRHRVGGLGGVLSGTATNVYSTGELNGSSKVGGLFGSHVNNNSWFNSSPLVYTWNGEKYTYVADVGNLLPKEVLSPSDLASIDKGDLVPKDDIYSMKISEEYNEIVYYDELSLSTYDHAPGYSIAVPLNRTAMADDIKTVNDTPTNPLVSCTDMYGNDCLDALQNYDDKWAYKDKSFVNSWILDFGNLSHKDSVQLVMRGARDYAASARMKADGTYQQLRTIEVRDTSGNWIQIYDKNDLGSDGTPRLRTIDLTGKFLSDDYHVKIGFDTMNVNYFAVDTSPQVPVAIHTYSPTKADLSFRGFTEIDRTYYNNHNYDKVSLLPEGVFKGQYGNFTKYGDVSPLLASSNNQFVIMHPGDHMDIEFPYVAEDEGLERSFILNNNAWYKHASNDDIGLLGKTVNPLPYSGMMEYTSDISGYPMTPENIEYLNTWNTRAYEGIPKEDKKAGSTIIDSYSEADVTGSNYLGGLVGYNEKEIRGSYATGEVNGSGSQIGGLVGSNYDDDSVGWIHDSYATGNVSGNSNIGGLVGYNQGGIINNSYAEGNVDGSGSSVGGFVGRNNNGSIDSSYAEGNVDGSGSSIGGFVGLNNADIYNSYSTGSVEGTDYSTGGFVGYNNGDVYFSYSTGGVDASGNAVGGFAGENGNDSVYSAFSVGTVSGVGNHVGGFIGLNYFSDYENSGWWTGAGQDNAIGHDSEEDGPIHNISYNESNVSAFKNNTHDLYTTIINKEDILYDRWDFEEVWGINPAENNGFPFLQFQGFENLAEDSGTGHHTSSGSSSSLIARNLLKNNLPPPTDCILSYNFSPSTGQACPKLPTIPPACFITQTLKLGSKGDQVKCLQTKLKISGDGIFGPNTKASVIAFQKSHPPLIPDGIVGPITGGVVNINI